MKPPLSLSVVLADDHPIVRAGLRALLSREPDLTVVGEAEDGLETVRLVERLRPDVLVLDLGMPGLHGLDVIPIVVQRSPQTRVVLLSASTDRAVVLEALQAGATGYVHKAARLAELLKAVRHAGRGKRFVGPPFSERDLEPAADRAGQTSATHERLTARERQVLQLAAEGHTCAEIAARLFISTRTVEMHRANLMRKLGLRTQTDLVRYALHRGIIPLEG